MQLRAIVFGWLALFTAVLSFPPAEGGELAKVPRYHLHEVTFMGPRVEQTDTPARDIELMVRFRHESGSPTIQVLGFWDGDGEGATQGNVFKVRFCPTQTGRWTIVGTSSNVTELRGQREGESLVCEPSQHHGFWLADGRYYQRSDGSHQYIVGNTHYSFLSRQTSDGPAKSDPLADIRANAQFYKKLRFTLFGDRYPDPDLKPFLDEKGKPTDDGQYSLRPNPAWFIQRVDPVVREGFAQDLICDLILCGPDTPESRSSLRGDPKPWLRYIAARYGAFPNVWICLANEWDIKKPGYSADEIRAAGELMRSFLPHFTPVSVHGSAKEWKTSLNGAWHDHTIIQDKIKQMPEAADRIVSNWQRGGGKPVVNDENAYQGEGDRFSELDVIEGCFGTFMGGGYPTTGEKYGKKLGQYFWGGFDAKAHSASDNLNHLRAYLDNHVEFWGLAPVPLAGSLFSAAPSQFRLLANDRQEYVLGSNSRAEAIHVELPAGQWTVRQIDLVAITTKTLGENVTGGFTFETPDSRAVATHFRRINEKNLTRVRPAWVPGESFRGWIDYPSSDGLVVHAYVFKSRGQGPFKLFVYTPGGGKSAAIEKQMRMLLDRGRLEPFFQAEYLVMVPAYRGAGDFGPEYENLYDYGGKEVDDVVWGARYLVEIGLADPAHVYFSGVSHGAKISMMIAERYRIATAVAPISGDYDISSAVAGVKVPGYCSALQPPNRIPVMRESILRDHPGFSDQEILAEARRRDPLLHVDQVQCPVFLLAGEKDYIVGHYAAAKLKQGLLKHQKSVIDKIYFGPKTNHNMQYLDTPQAAEMWRDIFNFFERRPISGIGTIPLAALESDYTQPAR